MNPSSATPLKLPRATAGSLSEPACLALELFRERTQKEATHGVFAPGRVNLIGEHTDYNGGFVLPFAIEFGIYVAARPRTDGRVRVWSSEIGNIPAEWDVGRRVERGEPSWSNYVRGVVAGFQATGIEVPGFDAVALANLPAGGGLSSSAALEVAFATLMESLVGVSLAPERKAILCQHAEHTFANTPCGIMDQFAVVFGRRDHLVLIDCRSQGRELVPLLDRNVSLLVANTQVKHELATGGYRDRRHECEAAARLLSVGLLREVASDDVNAAKDRLGALGFRRARHVTTENERTLAAVDCLRRQAWADLGQLMYASHASLRDDFEVSCVELDAVVDIARCLGVADGVWGCRMTGGGFGGCCVALVEASRAEAIAAALQTHYETKLKRRLTLFVTRPADGAHALFAP